MKMRKEFVLVLLALLAAGFVCPTSPARLQFSNTKEPGLWEYLEDLGCDISSDQADKYVDCMYNVWEEYSGDYALHTDECDDELALVPGCNMDIFGSGIVTYECDMSREAEGTYNDEYCPLGHDVELNIIVDWEAREFSYNFEASCTDDILDWVYDYIRNALEQTEGGGKVTERGWLLGEYHMTVTWSYECGPPRYCGNTGTAPETRVDQYSRHIVGRLVSLSHLEMGLQNQEHPLDEETLNAFSSWTELEAAWRGNRVWNCSASQ